jgi:NAD(P)-dependent dehydrogenase (short-subunit alcohol dehydrogenase family)
VVVIGGTSPPVTRAAARLLGAREALITLTYHRPEDRGWVLDLVEEINQGPGEAVPLVADLAHPEEVERVFDEVANYYGQLDLTITSIGVPGGHLSGERASDRFAEALVQPTMAALFVLLEAARRIEPGGRMLTVTAAPGPLDRQAHALLRTWSAPVEACTAGYAAFLAPQSVRARTLYLDLAQSPDRHRDALVRCLVPPSATHSVTPPRTERHPAMTEPRLPAPVRQAVDATNAGDLDAFLALFTPDGAVDDWGRVFTGSDAIRAWSDAEFIGKQVTLTLTGSRTDGDTTTISTQVGGNGFNGPSDFAFTLDGDRISLMRITG